MSAEVLAATLAVVSGSGAMGRPIATGSIGPPWTSKGLFQHGIGKIYFTRPAAICEDFGAAHFGPHVGVKSKRIGFLWTLYVDEALIGSRPVSDRGIISMPIREGRLSGG
ncbi:hypothetical protein [Cupriavidus taiwanensis]|uniref:hypothetical protein n=1 Tax=Cupriavidus taiwanensis TaxID=164546 RepID=UPI0011C05F69|nr:hypothetical protein [Cupriavidus taiwanensis]